MGSLMIDEFSLFPTSRSCGVFKEIQFHRQLAYLPFQRGNMCLVLCNRRRSSIFCIQLIAIKLPYHISMRLADKLRVLSASRRPSLPLRISLQICILNCGLCRRYGPHDAMRSLLLRRLDKRITSSPGLGSARGVHSSWSGLFTSN